MELHASGVDTSSKNRRNSLGSISSTGTAASTGTNKRKRKSIGTSTVKALAGCFLSTNKKRARMSIGTPGKAIPLDVVREKDVAKRFVELEVTEAYKAIRKQTGALGGNAAGGAIYGEITQSSFQRIVDFMKEHCELSESSLFLDVGSGLGKPNFHVAIDPGVEVSYGIELEELRWHLSLHNLKSVLKLDANKNKRNRTMFSAGDITDAKTLNPFSHIYSFDVGFPPNVMDELAVIFNRSTAGYFVSFHAPRKVIEMYGFNVELMGRVATAMAGSNEGHLCYFYRRAPGPVNAPLVTPNDKENAKSSKAISSTKAKKIEDGLLHIDPLFREGFDVLNRGRDGTLAWIESFFGNEVNSGRTRGQKAKSLQIRKRQERPLESYYRVVGKARADTATVKALTDSTKSFFCKGEKTSPPA
uniref:DOT1 domain-containing protein n=1 Tax=Globisporangium ultimum (strain ATCC 200006 / CBS 805.95 / DAOM BR144) TaxID=431595 RepID=K3WH09_GLOUD